MEHVSDILRKIKHWQLHMMDNNLCAFEEMWNECQHRKNGCPSLHHLEYEYGSEWRNDPG